MRPSYEHVPPDLGASWTVRTFDFDAANFDWHQHSQVELVLTLNGYGTRFLGDSVEPYGDPDLVLVGAHMPHTWRSEHEGRHQSVVVQFEENFLGPDLFRRPEFHPIAAMIKASKAGIKFNDADAKTMTPRIEELPELAPLQRTVALLSILADLAELEHTLLSPASTLPSANEYVRRRLSKVVDLVSQRFAEEIPLAEVAAHAAMTPSSFSRFFHREMGRTLTDYIAEVRLSAAKRMLLDTDMLIGDVAERSGFGNLSHFNKRFRDQEGMSPREFRRRYAPGVTAAKTPKAR
jgi:AraC-like DNA-binding protein